MLGSRPNKTEHSALLVLSGSCGLYLQESLPVAESREGQWWSHGMLTEELELGQVGCWQEIGEERHI